MTKRKLLFVDDEPDFAQLVEQQFEDKIGEYDVSFVFASNGLEALKKLNEHQDIELALVDINMPVMDGLEFVTRATKLDRLLKIIMVSAYGDMANLRKAMNRGAYDFIIKPVDFNDLADTIKRTFKDIDQIKAEEAELKRLQEIEKEMKIAKKILSSLLPSLLPPSFQAQNFEVFGTLVDALNISGGFYDFFPSEANKLVIVIGETEAKGIAPAIYMASAREAIRRFFHQHPNFEACIRQINNYLFYQKTEEIPNCSLFLGLFDTLTGELEYISAGTPPPLLIAEDGKVAEQPMNAILMGTSLETSYACNKIRLHQHESVIVRSPGIKKIKDKDNQIYPDSRFKEVISTNKSQQAAAIVDIATKDVSSFSEPKALSNDYIVLCLKYKGDHK